MKNKDLVLYTTGAQDGKASERKVDGISKFNIKNANDDSINTFFTQNNATKDRNHSNTTSKERNSMLPNVANKCFIEQEAITEKSSRLMKIYLQNQAQPVKLEQLMPA